MTLKTKSSAVPTFGEMADRHIATMESSWRNEKHRAQWRSTLATYAISLRPIAIDKVVTADVIRVLSPIWIATPETAARVRGRIESILDVPCTIFIPTERRDKKLRDKLNAESSSILSRLLDGLRHWIDYGLILPEGVAEATERYRDDSDPLGRFLKECTRPRIGARVTATVMQTLFLAWAKAAGESEWTIKGLSSALKERGLASKRSNGNSWVDVELTKSIFDLEAVPE